MSFMRIEATGGGVLQRLNPVSKLVAITPAMALLTVVTDPYTPLTFVGIGMFVTVVFGRFSPVRYLRMIVPLMGLAASFVLFYPFVVAGPEVAASPVVISVGPLSVRQAGLRVGFATGLRILALSVLSMMFVSTTETESFLRALVQNLGLPYQIGYSAMAAFRFMPAMRSDVETIRAAHTVRGVPDSDRLRDRIRRAGRVAMPLFVNAIRRAERTALAMDARAFGAFENRTHYREQRFTSLDATFVVSFWTISGSVIWLLWQSQLLGTITILR